MNTANNDQRDHAANFAQDYNERIHAENIAAIAAQSAQKEQPLFGLNAQRDPAFAYWSITMTRQGLRVEASVSTPAELDEFIVLLEESKALLATGAGTEFRRIRRAPRP